MPIRSRVASLSAVVVLLAAAASADATVTTAAPDPAFTKVGGDTCVSGGRRIDCHVMERIEKDTKSATWMLEACIAQENVPTTCLGTMTESSPLPAGMDESGHSFVVRCDGDRQRAWVVDLLWTSAGIDLRTWKLDLRALTTAPIVVDANGLKDVQLPTDVPLVPDPPHAWHAGDPQPKPECIPLSLDAAPTASGLDLTVRAASATCTSWKVTYDADNGSFVGSPLPGSAPPDLLRDAPGGPLTIQQGKKPSAADAKKPAGHERSGVRVVVSGSAHAPRIGSGMGSFSRR